MKKGMALALGMLAGWLPLAAGAGRPFLTEDPNPVVENQWELYLAGRAEQVAPGWQGALPELEANYGALPGVQLQMRVRGAFNDFEGRSIQYGLGDTRVGVKYQFVDETAGTPQVATFVLSEIPTGNEALGLGEGEVRVFLPVWVRKIIGRWTTYGGGGYWIHAKDQNQNHWFLGWVGEYQAWDTFALGAEITFASSRGGAGSDPRWNAGAVWNLTPLQRIMVSGGKSLKYQDTTQFYLAYALRFGSFTGYPAAPPQPVLPDIGGRGAASPAGAPTRENAGQE